MLRRNGARVLGNCTNMQSVAARRFFGLFYRWSSRAECLATQRRQTRDVVRNFHTSQRSVRWSRRVQCLAAAPLHGKQSVARNFNASQRSLRSKAGPEMNLIYQRDREVLKEHLQKLGADEEDIQRLENAIDEIRDAEMSIIEEEVASEALVNAQNGSRTVNVDVTPVKLSKQIRKQQMSVKIAKDKINKKKGALRLEKKALRWLPKIMRRRKAPSVLMSNDPDPPAAEMKRAAIGKTIDQIIYSLRAGADSSTETPNLETSKSLSASELSTDRSAGDQQAVDEGGVDVDPKRWTNITDLPSKILKNLSASGMGIYHYAGNQQGLNGGGTTAESEGSTPFKDRDAETFESLSASWMSKRDDAIRELMQHLDGEEEAGGIHLGDSSGSQQQSLKSNVGSRSKESDEHRSVTESWGSKRKGTQKEFVQRADGGSQTLRQGGLSGLSDNPIKSGLGHHRKESDKHVSVDVAEARADGPENSISPSSASRSQGDVDIHPDEYQPEPSSIESSVHGVEDLTKDSPPEPPKISTNLRKIMRALPAAVVVLTTSLTASADKSATPSESLQVNGRGMTVSSFTTLTLTPEPIIQFNIKAPSRTLDALMETRHFLVHILEATKNGARIAAAFTKGNSPDHSPFTLPDYYKIKPTRVEVRKFITGKDGTTLRRVSFEKPKNNIKDKASSNDTAPLSKFRISRVDFPRHEAAYWKKRNMELQLQEPRKLKVEERELEILLPRIVSDGVLRTLHCKVLDRGARGGRGDGFVHVGDHVLVLARVNSIISHRPVEEIAHKNQKALAYAHGNFTATKTLINPKESEPEPEHPFLEEETRAILQSYGATQRAKEKEFGSAKTEAKSQSLLEGFEPTKQAADAPDQAVNEAPAPDINTPELQVDIQNHVPTPTDPINLGETVEGVPIRKIKMKGMTLREINELTTMYQDKANSLRSELKLPPINPILRASAEAYEYGLGAPKDDELETTKDNVLEKGEDTDEPEHHTRPGPRITKHFSNRGVSLGEIKEAQKIGSELDIPRRFAQEAIQALPDADPQARKEFAILRAAEELVKRKEEIEKQRKTAKWQRALADLRTNGMANKNMKDYQEEEKPSSFTMYKVKGDAPPELEEKMSKVLDKVKSFKKLQSGGGLVMGETKQDGLFWRVTPTPIAEDNKEEWGGWANKVDRDGQVERVNWSPHRNGFGESTPEKIKEYAKEKESVRKGSKKGKGRRNQDLDAWADSVGYEEQIDWSSNNNGYGEPTPEELTAYAEMKEKEIMERRLKKEKSRKYQEADPWVDEFL